MAYVGDPFTEVDVRSFYQIEGRHNRDASGFAGVGEKTIYLTKSGISGPTFWTLYGSEIMEKVEISEVGLFHVRAATHGSPSDNRNNHPIFYQTDQKVSHILIHNGVVSPPEWMEKADGETDSEQLLYYWKGYGPEAWEAFQGWASVIIWDQGRVYCYKSGAPLYYKQSEQGVQLIQDIGRHWTSVPSETLFEVTAKGLVPQEKIILQPYPRFYYHRGEGDDMDLYRQGGYTYVDTDGLF